MRTEDLFKNKNECCGCELCSNICPTGAIKMIADEVGFLYPIIENKKMCIDCGKCIRICPLKNKGGINSNFEAFYAGSILDKEDLISCASGGIATILAREAVRNNGIVYGVSYANDWKSVEYIRCSTVEEIEKLKSSKYAQAQKGHIYELIESDLKSGIEVLFIGLPCEVLAVKNFFNRYKSNLFTVELVCHGPTSPEVHRQFCDYLENKCGSKVNFFSTRYKKNGKWKPFYIYAKTDTSKEYISPFHESSYGAAFRYLKRPSCYSCKIKGEELAGDIMIGDYHYVEPGMRGYNANGVSSILIHNKKGQYLIDRVPTNEFVLTQINARNALANAAISHSIKAPKGEKYFHDTFAKNGLKKANSLLIVLISNCQRKLKFNILKYGVRLKRLLFPSSKPNNQ